MDEIQAFKIFDSEYYWNYRDDAHGADLYYTNKKTLDKNYITSFSLQDCFTQVFYKTCFI